MRIALHRSFEKRGFGGRGLQDRLRFARGFVSALGSEGLQRIGEHVPERWVAPPRGVAQLLGEGLHQRGTPGVLLGALRNCLSQMRLGSLRRVFGEARPDAFASELDERFGGVQASNAHQSIEQRLHCSRVTLGGSRKTGDHRCGDTVVLLKDHGIQELSAGAKPFIRLDRDARRQRGRRASPLGDRELWIEMALHLLAESRHRRREEPPGRGNVPPDERLAIGEQAIPSLPHLRGAKYPDPGVITLRRSPCRLSGGAFEEARCKAARRQRSGGGLLEPLPAELLPRDQRQCERVDVSHGADRQHERQRDARTHRARAERALRPERELSRHRYERLGIALAKTLQHHPTELTLHGARRQRRCDLVERRSRRRIGEPIEPVDELALCRDLHAL